MQALETALDDGMDVVNLSLGESFQWPGYPTAEAADKLAEKGVTVVAAMGNDGESGVFSGSAPGIGEDVIAVASTDNPKERMDAAFVPPSTAMSASGPSTTRPSPRPAAATDPLVWLGRACAEDASEGDVNGKAALIIRGTCTFKDKYERAVAEGATSVVIYNDRSGPFGGGGIEDGPVPVVALTDTDGKDLQRPRGHRQGPVLEFPATRRWSTCPARRLRLLVHRLRALPGPVVQAGRDRPRRRHLVHGSRRRRLVRIALGHFDVLAARRRGRGAPHRRRPAVCSRARCARDSPTPPSRSHGATTRSSAKSKRHTGRGPASST